MADYSTLKAAVADVVKTNGSQAITGANLQSVLLSIINSIGGGGYIFAGVATPSTSVGTPDQNVFYITGAGTFANMGTSTTVPLGSIGIFKYNGSWSSSQIVIFNGIDDIPTGGSGKLVKSNGVAMELSSYQDAVAKLTRQTKLSNINYIDNTYVGSDGELHTVAATESYHYIALYMFPIADFQRIELNAVNAAGNSRLILYNADGVIAYNDNCTGRPYIIDNSAGSYAYMSVGTNIIPYMMEITVTPFNVDNGDDIPLTGVNAVTIPDDLVSAYLISNNAYINSVTSGYHSVYGLYIKNYASLCLIPYDGGNASYKKLWLTDSNGTVTEVSYPSNGCYAIDNSNGTYEYISFNVRDGRTCLYTAGVTDVHHAISALKNDVSNLADISNVGTSRIINVIQESDIIYDTYINVVGRPMSISQTASNRYYSVMFFPCKKYDKFTVSGNSTTSAYIKLYDAGLNEIASYQGKDVEFDNTSHNICYISFTSRSSESQIYLNTLTNVPVRDATTIDVPVWEKLELSWVDNKYINSSNVLTSISETATSHYKAVHNYPVGEARKISWDLWYGGVAKVVTSDASGNIIDVYSDHVKEIDNSDGSIAYISLSNNFVTNGNPIFRLYRTPLINDVVKSIMVSNYMTYPLAGKNMAVLGDSIMMLMSQGGVTEDTVTYVGTNGVTYSLTDLTNIGGLLYVTSTLEGGEVVSTTIQADIHNSNQSVLDSESWIPLKEALNANYVINTGRGGATISGNEITTAYPAHGEPTFNTMPNHCLELKRRVDAGEPTPDVIMMWAGTNDVRKFVVDGQWVEPTNFDEIMALDYETQLFANTDAAMNYKKTFYGALRFCLEYLYRNFPNALVILFSPIPSVVSPRTYERERYVGSYIKKMAERYSALYVDACVEMGITDIFDTETSHRWLYDGLHPNSAGKVLFCNYTSKKLNEIFFSKN